MKIADAEALLTRAVPRQAGDWADLGAGDGTFSRALARRLESGSRIYAVDRDRAAIASLEGLSSDGIEVIPVSGDFTGALTLPGVGAGQLSGMLFANALHFVAEPRVVLAGLLPWLRPRGRVVVVEYDGRRPSHWVPYPISASGLPKIVAGLGLAEPVITVTRPSAYGGIALRCRYGAGVVTQRLRKNCQAVAHAGSLDRWDVHIHSSRGPYAPSRRKSGNACHGGCMLA